MPAPRRRPFTVLDGMALVGAVALGLALIRLAEDPDGWWDWDEVFRPQPWSFEGIVEAVDSALRKVAYPAWTLTLAVAGLSLRGPRPPLRRLARGPGFAACGTVAVATLFYILNGIVGSLDRMTSIPWSDFHPGALSDGWLATGSEGRVTFGVVVASVWGLMVVMRTVRARPDWPDRAGRVLGCYWLALAFGSGVEHFLWAGRGAIN